MFTRGGVSEGASDALQSITYTEVKPADIGGKDWVFIECPPERGGCAHFLHRRGVRLSAAAISALLTYSGLVELAGAVSI